MPGPNIIQSNFDLPKRKRRRLRSPVETIARSQGKTLGLSVTQTWVYLFERNTARSLRWRSGRSTIKPWTDAQITTFMLREFPDKDSKLYRNVPLVRGRYNRGKLSKAIAQPKLYSHAYAKSGRPLLHKGERSLTLENPKPEPINEE